MKSNITDMNIMKPIKYKYLDSTTRKIIIVPAESPYEFKLVQKDPDEDGLGFCYGNQESKKILITETKSLSKDRVLGFPLRFILLNDYII